MGRSSTHLEDSFHSVLLETETYAWWAGQNAEDWGERLEWHREHVRCVSQQSVNSLTLLAPLLEENTCDLTHLLKRAQPATSTGNWLLVR